MAHKKYHFRAGDTLSVLRVEIRDSITNQLIPLDGVFTADLRFSIEGSPTLTRAMTVLTGASNGIVEYQFQSGELVAGTMTAQVVITNTASGKVATTVDDIIREVGPIL